jgi:hypothetical protein
MGRRLIALTVFLLGAAVSISACSQTGGSSGQADTVQTKTTGYGSDYAPMGQGDHHR